MTEGADLPLEVCSNLVILSHCVLVNVELSLNAIKAKNVVTVCYSNK